MSTGQVFIQAIPGFCDPISSLTHLTAAAAGIVGAVPLLRHGRGSPGRFAAVAIYVFSVVTLLLISGTYHSLVHGCVARDVMRRLDYSAIWLLIAGTFTAVHGILHRGRWRSWMLGAVWTMAVAGCVLQYWHFELFAGPTGWIFYAALGSVGLVSIAKVGCEIGFAAVWPIWLAGVFYAVGAVLEGKGLPTLISGSVGPHEVFHLAVLAGIGLHWMFIRRLLTIFAPHPAPAASRALVPAVASAAL